MELRRILCPMDFSEASHDAWRLAIDLAQQFGAELILLHVIKPLLPPGEAILSPDQHELLWRQAAQEAEQELDRLMGEAGPQVRITRLVDIGSAFDRILWAARRQRADLIVMGTHGRTGMAHALMGSVAEKVVRKAPCPVLTVRRREGAGETGAREAA